MKLLCGPASAVFSADGSDTLRVILYGQPGDDANASAGEAASEEIRRAKLDAPARAWDLLSLALSVVTADLAGLREQSPDGWTRTFELEVAVIEPDFWNSQRTIIERALSFLTTDIWSIHFHGGGQAPPVQREAVRPDEDSVVLLSGGLDSFVGALDLFAAGKKLLAVSQVVRGDASKQETFAAAIGTGMRHLQLNHNAAPPGKEESSQRARSLIFLAFGTLAATTLGRYHNGEFVPLYVCENGFIAINPPLTGGRLGSLSTRTAHPEFLARYQDILTAAGLCVRVQNPYCLATKGEMLLNCYNQGLLRTHAASSTSCGRFQRFNYKHCGRCVPCQVRRGAFMAWGVNDSTEYVYRQLGKSDSDHAAFDDVRAVAMAIASVQSEGLNNWLGPALSCPGIDNREQLKSLIVRGLQELAHLHQACGVK
ncbi:MAG: hypothetical protein A49_02280 [Methyloceanibacter sp.]|nr:MAG: hypothetical protein A49_02280 [Methyloceanibacter sp.]